MDTTKMTQYQLVCNSEAVDAITDKITIDKKFYGEIISSRDTVIHILKVNGFELDGVVKQIFESSIEKVREKAAKELEGIYKNVIGD